MGGPDRERLVADIDPELKDRAKMDPRSIRDIVESALSREFLTGATAAVQRRVEEKRSRINQLERERNERERELAEEREELERLESQLKAHENRQSAVVKEALETIDRIDPDHRVPTNPAIEKHAEKCGLTPEELLNEYTD